jgi:hypothetical protein
VCRRCDEDDLIGNLGNNAGPGRERATPDEGEIDLPPPESFEHICAAAWLQCQRNVWVSPPVLAEDRRQDGLRGRDRRSDPDIPLDSLGKVSDHTRHRFSFAHESLQAGPQGLPGWRQHSTSSKALEKMQAQYVLERADVTRHGGL